MIRLTFVTLGAFALLIGMADAQTSSGTNTLATLPPAVTPVIPPPPGVLSSTESQKTVDGNGDVSTSTRTTYGNVNGAASDSTTTMTMQPAPPPPPIVHQTTTTTMSTTGN